MLRVLVLAVATYLGSLGWQWSSWLSASYPVVCRSEIRNSSSFDDSRLGANACCLEEPQPRSCPACRGLLVAAFGWDLELQATQSRRPLARPVRNQARLLLHHLGTKTHTMAQPAASAQMAQQFDKAEMLQRSYTPAPQPRRQPGPMKLGPHYRAVTYPAKPIVRASLVFPRGTLRSVLITPKTALPFRHAYHPRLGRLG